MYVRRSRWETPRPALFDLSSGRLSDLRHLRCPPVDRDRYRHRTRWPHLSSDSKDLQSVPVLRFASVPALLRIKFFMTVTNCCQSTNTDAAAFFGCLKKGKLFKFGSNISSFHSGQKQSVHLRFERMATFRSLVLYLYRRKLLLFSFCPKDGGRTTHSFLGI